MTRTVLWLERPALVMLESRKKPTSGFCGSAKDGGGKEGRATHQILYIALSETFLYVPCMGEHKERPKGKKGELRETVPVPVRIAVPCSTCGSEGPTSCVPPRQLRFGSPSVKSARDAKISLWSMKPSGKVFVPSPPCSARMNTDASGNSNLGDAHRFASFGRVFACKHRLCHTQATR